MLKSKLFLSNSKKFLSLIGKSKSEKELNKFICKCENWKGLFPNYDFIASEFNIRNSGNNGKKIDILGFNRTTRKFIIFELKIDYNSPVIEQAITYRRDIQKNFSDVYLRARKECELPNDENIDKTSEIILITPKFDQDQIERAKEKDINITLIKYYWFENDIVLFDYINDDPDGGKIKTADTKKKEINKTKNIVSSEKEARDEIDKFFGEKKPNKAAFYCFFNFLKLNGKVNLEDLKFNDYSIRIEFNNTTFSVGIRNKVVLPVLTDIDVRELSEQQIIVVDRDRGKGVKMIGCNYGTRRFIVHCRNEDEVKKFCIYIKGKDFQPLRIIK